MPAVNPRIYVSLDPELHDAIRRIALGAHLSQSGVVAGMLEGQRDALFSLADAMDKARSIQGPLSGALAAVLGRSEAKVEDLSNLAMAELDALHLVLDQAVEESGGEVSARLPQEGRAGASAPLSPAIQPPITNKGARIEGRQGSKR